MLTYQLPAGTFESMIFPAFPLVTGYVIIQWRVRSCKVLITHFAAFFFQFSNENPLRRLASQCHNFENFRGWGEFWQMRGLTTNYSGSCNEKAIARYHRRWGGWFKVASGKQRKVFSRLASPFLSFEWDPSLGNQRQASNRIQWTGVSLPTFTMDSW